MARRQNTYEIALEHALRLRGVPLVGVREHLKASAAGREFKNFDYVVFREAGPHWLCEVKGRRLSQAGRGDAWITANDLTCLDGWQNYFGAEYLPVFAFVFDATGVEHAAVHHRAFGRAWQFWLIDHLAYQRLARPRSPKWRTLALSVAAFENLATPLLEGLPARAARYDEAEIDELALL